MESVRLLALYIGYNKGLLSFRHIRKCPLKYYRKKVEIFEKKIRNITGDKSEYFRKQLKYHKNKMALFKHDRSIHMKSQ